MNKLLSILLTIALALSLLGCNNDKPLDNTLTDSDNLSEEAAASTNTEILNAESEDASIINQNEELISSVEEEVSSNLIPAGDFSDKNSHWGIYKESGGMATFKISGGKLKVAIATPGRKEYSVQIFCDGFELRQGGHYELSFDVVSTENRTMEWRLQLNGGDYHPYVDQKNVEIGTTEKTIKYDFVMEEDSDPAPRLCFNIGDVAAGLDKDELADHEVIFDNVSLMLIDDSTAEEFDTATGEVNVNLNQIGYLTHGNKRAIIRNASLDDDFSVIDMDSQDTVYTGKLTPSINKGASGDKVAYADFNEVTTPGRYKVITDGNGESFIFSISDDVYDDVFNGICKMLYLQRCGMELTEEYAGDFAHKACHTQHAIIYGSTDEIDASGGWHDAGDYGRYVSPAAKTVADLMLAYENYPNSFTDNCNIPESGNGVADILDEVRYELEWMLKMQASDGGVYHKVTSLNFEGIVMPDKYNDKLFAIIESKTATAGFAGAMYMAARVYKNIDPIFANKCYRAADRAVGYVEKHMGERNYVNPSDVLTGEYKDGSSLDEYLWALCENYKTNPTDEVLNKLKSFDYTRIEEDGLGWATMTEYAYYAYLTSAASSNDVNYDFANAFRNCTDELLEIIESESYCSSIKDVYTWGSNMTICNNGIMLLMANELFAGNSNDSKYIEDAKFQLDYICGSNVTSYCFITGYGSLSPKKPHHRPSQALGKTMPGMLVGGPNSNLEDPYAKKMLYGLPAARCYADSAQSYSCNEVTIYWNSSLIYLMAPFVNH